jgi:hypothetical protein
MMLLNRLSTREWLLIVEGQLMEAIALLRREAKFIEHLPHCRYCQLNLELDVEWYIHLPIIHLHIVACSTHLELEARLQI